MSANVGAKEIVTEGLVLYLDAANRKSYTSGSLTWTDLISNSNGDVQNETTYSSEVNGTFVFDGIDDRLSGPLSNSSTNGISICSFFKIAASGSERSLVTKNANLIIFNGNQIRWFPDVTSAVVTVNTELRLNQWYYIGVSHTGSICSIYKNSERVYNSTTAGQFLPTYTQQTRIGAYNPPSDSRYFNGNISTVIIYNRALTDAELVQNYNSLKSRFGLP